jgi:hypothetical protein
MIRFQTVVSFCGLLAFGCIPYRAHPTLDYTPAVQLPVDSTDVRAFRVDITCSTHDVGLIPPTANERLTEIPVTHETRIGPQFKAGTDYGFVIIGVALNYVTRSSDSLAMRIYRPGFETVEIRTWERVNGVTWIPATTHGAQEAALDKLLPSGCEREPRTEANKKALEFVAGEYDRLATGTADGEQRKRLEDKARKLRRTFQGEPNEK